MRARSLLGDGDRGEAKYFVPGRLKQPRQVKISITGMKNPTNQPRKDPFHMYSLSLHLPQFQTVSRGHPSLWSLWLQRIATQAFRNRGGRTFVIRQKILDKKLTIFPVFFVIICWYRTTSSQDFLSATSRGSIRSIPEQRKIRGAAEEAVLNKVHIFIKLADFETIHSMCQCWPKSKSISEI
jgi:hypothetical protein